MGKSLRGSSATHALCQRGVVCFLLFLFFCSFTRIDFNRLKMGMPASKIVRLYGEPYSVRDLGGGRLKYQYIERVSMNQELVYENHYFLTIINGQLVDKYFREETRQPFDQMYQSDPNYPHYP